MNLFKAVFSDEPDSPPHESDSSLHESDQRDPDQDYDDDDQEVEEANTAWSFGGLIQTLASKSESVLENYRRDLEEFSSGLRSETAVIREAASRAVKDLPASLDVGTSVAQESLESVGQAIDDIGITVWKSTAQIISQGRDSLLSPDFDSDSHDSSNNDSIRRQLNGSSSDLKRYSRIDALVRALQSDVNTYLEEPDDLGNFNEWKLEFELDKKEEEEIAILIEENEVVEEIYEKFVPNKIDHESFWSRYFYKLHKLKQAEEARAKLVKRAISGNEEEDLSWDFDDDDDSGYEPIGNTSGVSESKGKNPAEVATGGASVENVEDLKIENDGKSVGSSEVSELKEKKSAEAATSGASVETVEDLKIENDGKNVAPESKTDGGDKLENENVAYNVPAAVSEQGGDKLDVKKETSEVKVENDSSESSSKDSDISVVSSQPSMPEEEDIGWDEIEDIEGNDENRGDAVGSASRIDLRKRLSVASEDQDEDLSWDIEDDDDDDAVKS